MGKPLFLFFMLRVLLKSPMANHEDPIVDASRLGKFDKICRSEKELFAYT